VKSARRIVKQLKRWPNPKKSTGVPRKCFNSQNDSFFDRAELGKASIAASQHSAEKGVEICYRLRKPRSAVGRQPLTQSSKLKFEKSRKYVRKDETIAVDPIGVLGVESHELVPDNVSHRGHAHRGARVARVGRESGIDLYRTSISN
jgi:hypothetical protein